MKKLLIAPFLLASLFSFGGELKANSNSRYELPDPRSSLSESQSNSKDVWYLLNQIEEQDKNLSMKSNWAPTSFEKLKITRVSNRTICARLASQEKRWIEQIDLGRDEYTDQRYKAHTKCIKGSNENEANYFLRIASTKMAGENYTPDYYLAFRNYSSFDTLYFKDFSECNFAKSNLDNWFNTLENKFFSKKDKTSDTNHFVRYSTKCFSKT